MDEKRLQEPRYPIGPGDMQNSPYREHLNKLDRFRDVARCINRLNDIEAKLVQATFELRDLRVELNTEGGRPRHMYEAVTSFAEILGDLTAELFFFYRHET